MYLRFYEKISVLFNFYFKKIIIFSWIFYLKIAMYHLILNILVFFSAVSAIKPGYDYVSSATLLRTGFQEKDSLSPKKNPQKQDSLIDERHPQNSKKTDILPVFKHGPLNLWISQHIIYPESAFNNSIEGKVYVQFFINTDGSVSDPKILRGVCPVLDEEAKRVVLSMPPWEPGYQKGKRVRVSYTLPINFILSK